MGCDETCVPGSPGTWWDVGLFLVPLALGNRDPREGKVSLAFLHLRNGTARIFLLISRLLWVPSVKYIRVSRRRTLEDIQSSFLLRLSPAARWVPWELGVAQNEPVLQCRCEGGYQEPCSHLWNQNTVVIAATVLSSRKVRHSEGVYYQSRIWAWPKVLWKSGSPSSGQRLQKIKSWGEAQDFDRWGNK